MVLDRRCLKGLRPRTRPRLSTTTLASRPPSTRCSATRICWRCGSLYTTTGGHPHFFAVWRVLSPACGLAFVQHACLQLCWPAVARRKRAVCSREERTDLWGAPPAPRALGLCSAFHSLARADCRGNVNGCFCMVLGDSGVPILGVLPAFGGVCALPCAQIACCTRMRDACTDRLMCTVVLRVDVMRTGLVRFSHFSILLEAIPVKKISAG